MNLWNFNLFLSTHTGRGIPLGSNLSTKDEKTVDITLKLVQITGVSANA